MRMKMGIGQVAGVALLVALAGPRALHGGKEHGIVTWHATDWSVSGSYQGATDVETRVSPGMIALAGDPAGLTRFVDPPDVRSFYPMESYNGKLYAGYCMAPINMGDPGQIWSYDPAGGQPMALEYLTNDEGILVLKARDGRLMSPGDDDLGNDYISGNLYVLNGAAWSAITNLPSGAAYHCWDVETYGGYWYVTTSLGQVQRSNNQGASWETISLGGGDRTFAMIVFDGKLFVQTDGGPQPNVIKAFDGANWSSVSCPGYNFSNCQGVFAVHQEELYLHVSDLLFRYNRQQGAFQSLYCPTDWAGWTAKGFASIGGELYMSGGYEQYNPDYGLRKNGSVYRRVDDTHWELVCANFGQDPQGYHEHVRSFLPYRGRLYACTSNGLAPGGAVYVAPAAPSGNLVSNPFDFGGGVQSGVLFWNGVEEGAGATDVGFQIRSATTPDALESATYMGPDGRPDSYYRGNEALSAHHMGKRWFQYKVFLTTSNPLYTPNVESITILASVIKEGPGLGADPSQ